MRFLVLSVYMSVCTLYMRDVSTSGEGHGNPLQYSCLEDFMDRGAWRVTVGGVTKSQTQLSD